MFTQLLNSGLLEIAQRPQGSAQHRTNQDAYKFACQSLVP